jgi:hypothetical protein
VIKSSHVSGLHSSNNSVHASYHGDRNTGLTNSNQQKHRHTSSNGPSVASTLKQSLIAVSNSPFMSVSGGTIENSQFRGHVKNALSMGTYENSAKMVKRNNYMTGNNSLKSSQNSSMYGFMQ